MCSKRNLCPLTLLFSLFFALPGGRADAADEHDPASELASFQIADGFDVNLFASEKDGVIKPIQMRFDPQGRIWVIGSTVYPQLEPGQTPNDKVLVLDDTDHDGKCDKVTVFADGLMIPTGIELGDGGVYVGHGTELLILKDTDGDLKADERRVVLRGFGTGDNHQNINSFLWGPGGELWFCQGLHTHSNVETPWGIVRMNQAGLWRFRPRLRKLEGFYGSVYEPQNPWGYVFTDWGEPIVIAGNNSSPIYPVPGLTSRHLDLPPTIIWKNGQGRKSSGADIVGTRHFPDEWQGTLITGGYINNAVWALRIVDDGSGFALEDREPLIKSTSRNFRPVDVKFGPDGSLYICDWYNPIIGHYQASFRHPDRDKLHGRIWRVTAHGRPLTKPPQLEGAALAVLLDNLESNDRWTRQFSKRALADRATEEVVAAVQSWVAQPRSERALKEALGVLQSHEAVSEALLRRLAAASEPGARAYAAAGVGRWADRLTNGLEILRPLASDANARVRLNAIVAASYIADGRVLDLLASAAEQPSDKFIDYALKQAVYASKSYWHPAVRSGKIDLARAPGHLNLLLRTEPEEALGRVRALVTSASRPDERAALWKTLLRNGSSADIVRMAALTDASLRQELGPIALESVRTRRMPPEANAAEVLRAKVGAGDPFALRLAGLWQIQEFRPTLVAFAANTSGSSAQRIAAVDALGGFKSAEVKELLANVAAEKNETLAASAIISLANIDVDRAARCLADYAGTIHGPELWQNLFTAVLQRHGGAAALAKALQHRALPADARTIGLRVMNESGRRDEDLARVLAAPAERKLSLADVPALAADVRSHANPERGAQVLKRAELGCIGCHAVKGEGGKIGPDLGAVGTAQPIDFIIGAILDPQKEVKEGYMVTAITTKEGEDFQGYWIRENDKEVVLRDLLQNAVVTIPKSSIAQKRQIGSPMPAGLTEGITREEFVDLVRYLSDLGK